jgi:hypothetical protein
MALYADCKLIKPGDSKRVVVPWGEFFCLHGFSLCGAWYARYLLARLPLGISIRTWLVCTSNVWAEAQVLMLEIPSASACRQTKIQSILMYTTAYGHCPTLEHPTGHRHPHPQYIIGCEAITIYEHFEAGCQRGGISKWPVLFLIFLSS